MTRILFFLIAASLATITVNGQLKIDNATFFISAGATVTVQGDVTSNVDIQGTGLLLLKGSTLQNIDMGGFLIPNLEVDNVSNVSLSSNAMINNSLLFTNGKLQLNAFDLRLALGVTSVQGSSSARFVITNGAGRLVKRSLGGSAFTYPVGFSASRFNPLTITNSGTVDTVGVRCMQNVLSQGLTGSTVTTDFANNPWVVTEAAAGGSILALTGEWVAGDELSGFNRNKVGIARYNTGTDWDLPASSVLAASGSGPYNRTRNNVTTVGVFAVADLDKVNAARLNLKVFLQGPYSGGTMTDGLRTSGVIPTTQPYSSAMGANFDRIGVYDGSATVNETVPNAGVFDVANPNDDIVDWVYISLQDGTTPATKMQTRAALLQRDGDIVEYDVASGTYLGVKMPIDADANYHLLIAHRNHLAIRTPVSQLLQDNGTFTYNFTDGQSKAFQDVAITSNAAMAQNGSVFLMWAGNANGDIYTRVTSQILPPIPSDAAYILGNILSGNPNATGGYTTGDINMDGKTRATSQILPPIPSDVAHILSIPLSGNSNATRREHK
jgi:hypothetical protein